ncbi:hypothetical protein Q0M94_21860 (plasmid) [Deinococcus radiomollis]|uniref:hypothetical protein n=1 Tax=Deinococcus radiomollis TaxID=468916 RepID=UPI0038917E94
MLSKHGMSDCIAFSFRPGNVQFVLYDVHAAIDDREDSLWGRDGELGPLSVRTAELSVGLFDNCEVEISVAIFEVEPIKPDGIWEIEAEASLLVQSGELGVRDVTSNTPERIFFITKGRSRLRILGAWRVEQINKQAEQLFHIQIWPVAYVK